MGKIVVTSAEFQKSFGKYREIALSEPVSITNHGRESLVLVSAAEYERLKRRDRRALSVWELTSEQVAALKGDDIPEEHAQFDDEVER